MAPVRQLSAARRPRHRHPHLRPGRAQPGPRHLPHRGALLLHPGPIHSGRGRPVHILGPGRRPVPNQCAAPPQGRPAGRGLPAIRGHRDLLLGARHHQDLRRRYSHHDGGRGGELGKAARRIVTECRDAAVCVRRRKTKRSRIHVDDGDSRATSIRFRLRTW